MKIEGCSDFTILRNSCLANGILFEDPDFPANNASLKYSPLPNSDINIEGIEWLRPGDLVDDPKFYVDGYSRFDVNQGGLGDCWFVAAMANLTQDAKFFNRVVPPDQDFQKNYAGIFHFNFWYYGKWVEVVIDDRLPTINGELISVRSTGMNEFWSTLLEKAYAKLHGSYQAIDGGFISDALVDFTGGVTEEYITKEAPPNLFDILMKAAERGSMIGCTLVLVEEDMTRDEDPNDEEDTTLADDRYGEEDYPNGEEDTALEDDRYGEKDTTLEDYPNGEEDTTLEDDRNGEEDTTLEDDRNGEDPTTKEGLIRGHAYSITKVCLLDIPRYQGKLQMIRIRNPWGNETEWNGPWSDGSSEWRDIPPYQKQEIGLSFDSDGEFWMSYEDFLKHFDYVSMCHISPDSLTEEQENISRRKWEMSMFEGEWTLGVTAGGCSNNSSFWHNPQYIISLEDPDEEDEDNMCTVIVDLMQKNRPGNVNSNNPNLTIGFGIYHLTDRDMQVKPQGLNFFEDSEPVAISNFGQSRQVSKRFRLHPGHYLIVPSTFDPNEEGEFIIRVFSETKNNMVENDDEVGFGEIDVRITPTPKKEDDPHCRLFDSFSCCDEEVYWQELKCILDDSMGDVMVGSEGFCMDAVRSMVAMWDKYGSGRLDFDELEALLLDLDMWRGVFKLYDPECTGSIDVFHLRGAFNSAGYRLNNRVLNALAHRYGSWGGKVTFHDFILCAIKVRTFIQMFRERDIDNSDMAFIYMDDCLDRTIYS